MGLATWDEVLNREDLVGGQIEFQATDGRARGPISQVLYMPEMVVVTVDWLAKCTDGQRWEAVRLDHGFTFFTSMWVLTRTDAELVEWRPDMSRVRKPHPEFEELAYRVFPVGAPHLDPAAVEGLAKLLNPADWDFPRLELTEAEWIALCGTGEDSDYDESDAFEALPPCCANVSALRESLAAIRRRGGVLLPFEREDLCTTFQHVRTSHGPDEWDWTLLNRIMEEVDPGSTTRDVEDDSLEALVELERLVEERRS